MLAIFNELKHISNDVKVIVGETAGFKPKDRGKYNKHGKS